MKQLSHLIHLKRYRRKFPQNPNSIKNSRKENKNAKDDTVFRENSIVGFI